MYSEKLGVIEIFTFEYVYTIGLEPVLSMNLVLCTLVFVMQ